MGTTCKEEVKKSGNICKVEEDENQNVTEEHKGSKSSEDHAYIVSDISNDIAMETNGLKTKEESDIEKIDKILDKLSIDEPNKLLRKPKATRASARRRTIAITPSDDLENMARDVVINNTVKKSSKLHPDDVQSPRRVTRN